MQGHVIPAANEKPDDWRHSDLNWFLIDRLHLSLAEVQVEFRKHIEEFKKEYHILMNKKFFFQNKYF